MPEFRMSCYGLVRHRGQILVLRRPHGKRFGGRWELPGGKMEPGETLETAVRREVLEETGLTIQVRGLAGSAEMPLKKCRVILLIFEATAAARTVKLSHEHQDWRWVEPRALTSLPMTPPMRAFWKTYRAPKRPARTRRSRTQNRTRSTRSTRSRRRAQS